MPDFAPPGALLAALLPEITLATGALLLLLLSVWRGEHHSPTRLTTRCAIAVVGLTAASVVVCWTTGAGATPDGRLAGDGFRWAVDLVLLLGAGGALALLDAEQGRTRQFPAETPVLMLLSLCGMMLLAGARDLLYVYLGIELMSLGVYALVAINRRSARGAEASLKYFLLGAFSSAFLLYGIALLYGAAGDTRLDALAVAATAPSPMMLIGLGLLLVGFAFKVAAAPFHLWTPDVYDGAPLPITAFMAATVKTAAFAAFLRVMIEGFGGAVEEWHAVIWWLAAITMLVGNVVALAQRNIKRMMAYSSVAHAGYLLVAVVANSAVGTAALVFYLLAFTLATLALFAALGVVTDGRDTAPMVDDLAGLWHVRPALAVVMAVSLLAFLGFPLAGGAGFFAKWYILQSVLTGDSPQHVLAVVLVLTSVVSAGYYLGTVATMFMRERAADAVAPPPSTRLSATVMVAAVALLLVLGVYPSPAAEMARRAGIGAVAPPAAPSAVATVPR